MSKLIDNHCHLDFPQYDGDRDTIIQRCREKLKAVINSGSDIDANKRVLQLAAQHPDFIHPCIGAHPTKIESIGQKGLEDVKASIREHQDRIVAVGEIGLDYFHHKEDSMREEQEDYFKPLLQLAEELDLPAVIHSRDAEKRCLEILSSYNPPEVIMHCFNGNQQTVQESIDRGYWISVSTQVLYSSRVEEIVSNTPSDRILLETDAPFLYPGDQRNEPWRIHESLDTIAGIKEEEKEVLGEQFNKNTEEAYRTTF